MSLFQHQGSLNEPDLQIWDNAAFDNGEFEVKPDFLNQSFDSDSGKENKRPPLPLRSNRIMKDTIRKPLSPTLEDEIIIDNEIEVIEKEMSRLSARLKALRLRKTAAKAKNHVQGSRVLKKTRRGVSMGPVEIIDSVKSKQPIKQDSMITPVQNRRQSCFLKLQDIDEEKGTRDRGRRYSMSVNPTRTASKFQSGKQQALTAIGSKRVVKGEILSTIQPKNLFQESAKKPLKPGRIVPSRYNQINNQNNKTVPVNVPCKSNNKSENRVKKRWEIPSQVVVYSGEMEEESPPSVAKIGAELPKIKSRRCVADSPRDSGAAKRVADLLGRKAYFSLDQDSSLGIK